MLSVNINRDIEQYQEAVMAGFNARQSIAVILSVLIGAGAVCLSYFVFGLPLEVCVYIAIPCCSPIVLSVFGREGSISFWEKVRGSHEKGKKLFYYSTETDAWKKQKARDLEKERADRKKSLRRSFFTSRHRVAKPVGEDKSRKEEKITGGCDEDRKDKATKKADNKYRKAKNKKSGPVQADKKCK